MKRERRTRGWVRILVSGLAVGLMILVIGDRGAQMAVSGGIDPFDILDLQVKPNVLIILDNTGSMGFSVGLQPGLRRYPVGPDDPMSRIYQAKQGLRAVVRENKNKINFGIVAFNNRNSDRPLTLAQQWDDDGFNVTNDNWPPNRGLDPLNPLLTNAQTNTNESGDRYDGPFIYVSGNEPTSANAAIWSWDRDLVGAGVGVPDPSTCGTSTQVATGGHPATRDVLGYFCDIRNLNADWNAAVRTAVPVATGAQSTATFHSFGNRGAHAFPYPAAANGAVWNAAVDIRVPNVAPNPPFTRAAGLTVETCPEGVPDFSTGVPSDPTNNPANCRIHPPVCAPGGDCRYYMQSRFLRDGLRYVWDRASGDQTTKLKRVEAFTCFNPPGGLLGFEPDPDNDGDFAEHYQVDPADPDRVLRITERRPCFAFADVSAGDTPANVAATTSVYYYSTPFFGGTTAGCGDANVLLRLENVKPCDATDNGIGTEKATRPAAPVSFDPLGNPRILPFPINPANPIADASGNPGPPPATGTTLDELLGPTSGLRNGGGTPMGRLFDNIRTANPPLFPARTGWPGPPADPRVHPTQKNFVLIVTDGNDRCMGSGGSFNAFSTEDTASRFNAQVVQRMFDNQFDSDGSGGPAVPTDWLHGAELLVVAFTNDVNVTFSNRLAKAGSGGETGPTLIPPRPGGTPADGLVPCTPGPGRACRDAFVARTPAELLVQLRAALKAVGNDGEFSAQSVGTVNENVFEFVGLAGRDPANPDARYRSTLPIVFQSTFLMPNFEGRLKAFRSGVVPLVPIWEAGAKLNLRVSGALGAGTYTFAQLHASATIDDPTSALIKRRIFTNEKNGASVFSGSAPASTLLNVPLWPPTTGAGQVAPTDLSVGQLDGSDADPADLDPTRRTGLAIGNLTFTQLQAAFPDVCRGTPLPAECNSPPALPADQQARARKEAREIILAFTAGARVAKETTGLPRRNAAGDLLYQARSWVLAESTLSTPAVIGPPPAITPALHPDEWKLYLDGPRDVNNRLVTSPDNPIEKGFGLRNPDLFDPGAPLSDEFKPIMTVVYAGTNHLLHAFRAGPEQCIPATPPATPTCPGGGLDSGGEELWAFAPFDTLPRLKDKLKRQTREDHTFMIASSIRFGDVFLPGSFTDAAGVPRAGRWRTLMVFGRGIGGKYYTAMDVTGTGPFTRGSLFTKLPQVLWNRGNPDTDTGMALGTAIGVAQDTVAYAKMGETWSVPSILPLALASQLGGNEYVVAMGSGFSDVGLEGQTVYVVAPTTGNVLFSHDVPPAGGPPLRRNALVAGPTGFIPAKLAGVQVNPADGPTEAVVIGDLHGRIWKFDVPLAPPSGPGPDGSLKDFGTDQPIGVSASVLDIADQTDPVRKLHAYAVTGHDNRIFFSKDAPAPATPPFKIIGLRGDNGTDIPGFPLDFPQRFRGSTQPLVATIPPFVAETFFIGTQFNPPNSGQANPCISSFDSFLAAVQGGNGGAAIFDLSGTGDDRFAIWTDQKVQNITARGGKVILDIGLGAGAAPPPPPPPAPQTPNSRPSVFTRAMRLGTTVCN